MRRCLVICTVTLIVLAAFATWPKSPRVAVADTGQQAAHTTDVISARKMTVLATAISARALALNALDPHATIYLTNASAPNQIFTLGAIGPGGPAASVQIAAVAGTGTTGSLGDGGAATSAQLDLSESSLIDRSAIAIAADGTIYIADTGNATIRTIAGPTSSEAAVIRSAAGRWAPRQNLTLVEPLGIALDRAGNLYIADHAAGAVYMMPVNGGQLETLAHVTSPASIAVTQEGATVFVASPEASTVFAISTQTHEIEGVAGFLPATAPGPSSCNMSTVSTAARQICPSGLAVDATGGLYISDLNGGRIIRVSAQTAAVTIVASGLNKPGSLAIDADGNLYAVEQGLNRIVAFAQVGTSQGSISLAPASAAYGNELAGGFTATQSFTLSNISSTAVTGLTIPQTTNPADFTVQSNSCTATLVANASCSLSIAFTPTTAGARSDTLTVTDANSSDSASTVLSGTGDDFQIQLANGQLMSVSVQAGAAAKFNLQVVPDNTFSGTVTFVCPTNLPTNTTCTFSSPTVNVTAGTPAPFSATFQTTGIVNPFTSGVPLNPNVPPIVRHFPALLLIVLIASLLSSVAFGANKSVAPLQSPFQFIATGSRLTGATFALSAAVVLMLAGCSKGRSPASIGATPAGTSTMAITGTSQNASRALTVTLNIVVTQ